MFLTIGETTPEMLEEHLQDLTSLKWYIIPLFLVFMYIISNEMEKKKFSVLFGALAFWLVDVFNETWNSMVYATTGQPVWGTVAAGNSSFQILIGYNIEISFMFFILGICCIAWLPKTKGYEGESFWDANKNYKDDPHNMYYKMGIKSKDLTALERKTKTKAVLGRIIPALVGSFLAVCIEIILNQAGLLTWEKPWWQWYFPYILYIIGYCPFFFAAYIIHDLPRKKQLIGLGIIAAIVAILLIVSGSLGMLGPQL